jgi:hypothetical protein
MAMRDHVREDGSVNHIVIHDTEKADTVLGTLAGQGYGVGSSWSRGVSWALYGFILSYIHTKENRYLETAKKVARSIHNVYLRPFTFHDDGVVNVPFRISQDKYNDFTLIHDKYLGFYDTDFTNYIRTLLVEYTSKTFSQREYLYAFRKIKNIREAIIKSNLCKFYNNGNCDIFVPVSIETSPVYDHNYIVGITNNIEAIAIRLRDLQDTVLLNDKIKITEEMSNSIYECLDIIYEEEYKECSD